MGGVLWRICGWLYELASLVAEFVGGWPILVGIVTGIPTAVWGFVADLGPLTVIVSLFAAALAMIVWEMSSDIIKRIRRTNRKNRDLVNHLFRELQLAEVIWTSVHFEEKKQAPDPAALEALYDRQFAWARRTEKRLFDSLFIDYLEFRQCSIDDKKDKLLEIILRISKEGKFSSHDILPNRYRG